MGNPELNNSNLKSSISKTDSEELTGLVSSNSLSVDNILANNSDSNSQEEKLTQLGNILDKLSSELSEATKFYKELFGEDFGYIESAIINLDYLQDDEFDSLNPSNIEINALFLGFEANNEEKMNKYNSLLSRLKSKDSLTQAYLLGFFDIIAIYIIYKDTHKSVIDNDGFKSSIFNNPDINSNYLYLIEKIFDLIDSNPEFMKKSAKKIFSKYPSNILDNDLLEAKLISKIFE